MSGDRGTVAHRLAAERDLPRICEIYNHYVRTSTCTADLDERTLDDRRAWMANRPERFPVWVLVDGADQVLGYFCLNRWSDRKAYDICAEVSFYLDHREHGKGYGNTMMDLLLGHARQHAFHTLLARITSGNPSSEALHRRVGFTQAGLFRENAKKFGAFIDVGLWQKML